MAVEAGGVVDGEGRVTGKPVRVKQDRFHWR